MAKRVKYKIGDVFTIPLEDDLKGVGRVLKNNMEIIFIELYRMSPIKNISEFNFEVVSKEKPLVRCWCYDTFLTRGTWKIINNIPIKGNIDMPYFWSRDIDNEMKPYIMKGTNDSHRTFGERIYISEEDIDKYELSGIGDGIAEQNLYIYRLRKEGLM